MTSVSFSAIRDWNSCRQLYYYRRVLKLRKRAKPYNLTQGSFIHECLEAYYKGEDYREVIAKYALEFDGMMEEERLLYGEMPRKVNKIVKNYIRHYKNDGMKTLAIELEFEDVEVLPGIFVKGKIDWICQNAKGVWVSDRKTTSKAIPNDDFRLLDLQTAIYVPVAKLLGYPEPRGIMFDYILTQVPGKPRLTKAGKMSRQRIRTDYETMYKFILDNGLNPRDYSDLLERTEEYKYFERKFLPKPKSLTDNLLRDVGTIVKEMEYLSDVPYRHFTRLCPGCEYYNLCVSEMMDLDTDFILKHEYITKEDVDGDEAPRPD